MTPDPPVTEVVVGRLGAAHGVHGELAVRVRTDEPERRFTVGSRLTVEPDGAGHRCDVTLASVRGRTGRDASLLVTFAEVTDRDQAAALAGSWLLARVPAHERPDDADEYYDHQLVGLAAVDADGEPIGTVAEVLHLPAQDVLAVDLADGRQVLVPFVAEIVVDVDLPSRSLRVRPPAGLLDPDGADGAAPGSAPDR